jgi:hypothetical protein
MKTRYRAPPTAKDEASKPPQDKTSASRRRPARPAAAAARPGRGSKAAVPKAAPTQRVNLSAKAHNHKAHGRSPAHDLVSLELVEFAVARVPPGRLLGYSEANLAPAGAPVDVQKLTTVNLCAAYRRYHGVDLREPTFRKRVQEIFGTAWKRLNADPAATLARVAECKAHAGAELAAAALGATGAREATAAAKAAPAAAAPAIVAPAAVVPAVVAPAAVAPAAPVEEPAPAALALAAPAARALVVYGDADEWGPPPQMAAPVFLEMDD